MIRKLRMKLIFASMLSLLSVLFVIFTFIAVLNYREIITDADTTLKILAENDGSFPSDPQKSGDPYRETQYQSPELPYESRYFSVFLTSKAAVISVNTAKIAAVDTAEAIDYAQAVIENGRLQGFADDYRYLVYTNGNETHIVFLDCGRELDAFSTFLLTSIGVSAAGMLAVGLLLFFLSGRIVRPFSENYEKQKRFITDAGHELKTPLTVIDADADVLEMDVGENEWIIDIKSQTKRLAELTNNLILLARMDEQPRSEKIDFPISDVTEETLEAFQTLAKARNRQLTGHIQPLLTMHGDEKAIRQLIAILLDNAIKYSDDQGRIELRLEKRKNSLLLSVFNTAEHVPKETLPHLFDRFYRADPSRNSRTGGYGLGLSIAAAIVSIHKGKITAVTQDEKSLSVTAAFPASTAAKK